MATRSLHHISLSLLSCAVLTACGQDAAFAIGPGDSRARALGDSGDIVNVQTRVIEGEFTDNDNSAECLALRAKIFKDRTGLKLTSEWKAVDDSPEYNGLQEARAHWAGAGCNTASSTPAQACGDLGAKISSEGDKVAATPQWASLVGTGGFANLFNDWDRAVKLSCVKM